MSSSRIVHTSPSAKVCPGLTNKNVSQNCNASSKASAVLSGKSLHWTNHKNERRNQLIKGFTQSGETVRANESDRLVAISCSDNNFIDKVIEEKPNFVNRFFIGAYSNPRDWWGGVFFCYMRLGAMGEIAKINADNWARDLEMILTFATKNPDLSARLLGIYLSDKAKGPELYGRLTGGAFTNYATTGGRIGRKSLGATAKIGAAGVNFALSSTGAAVLAVKHGSRDIASIFDAVLTGDYKSKVSNQRYKELFRMAVDSKDPLTGAEADVLVKTTESILYCIRNPQAHVPIID